MTPKLLSMLLQKASHAIEDGTTSKGYGMRKRTREDEAESDVEEVCCVPSVHAISDHVLVATEGQG